MRITVFGAFGSVGARTVEEARRRGHDVTAVSRGARPGAEVGDARVVDDVVQLSEGRDLVISATRPVPGAEPELVAAARSLLAGTAKAGCGCCWSAGRRRCARRTGTPSRRPRASPTSCARSRGRARSSWRCAGPTPTPTGRT
ncbi:hypothetical protein ACFQV2_18170 [Actinokineospora soli]|uniref:NAD(P)-binding domain-containing protein n=1 Tax=Actinokineospora soli TaxID=1048753 RepID=A0ABW2TMZ8_9PSEU